MKHLMLWVMLIFCVSVAQCQPRSQWIHFDWHGEMIFGKYYPRVAMSVPLKIEHLPYPFCAQFDLGATTTMLYENSFRPFDLRPPFVLQKQDTTLGLYYLYGKQCFFLKAVNLRLDQTPFPRRNVVLVPDYGETFPADSMHTASPKLVGTIAPDLFQNKILVIDFARQRMAAFDRLPARYARANFVPSVIRKGRIKIPVQIGDSTRYLMFDTGNCLADLLLDKESIRLLSDANEPAVESLNGNTWGQAIVYYSKRISQPVFFHGQPLPIKQAMYSDLNEDVQFNHEEKIIGLIGPLLFADKTIIIDYQRSVFGIL